MYTVFSYIAMALSVSGNWFVNKKDVNGLKLWLIGSTIWSILALYKQDYAQLVMFLVYSSLNIHGIITWSKDKKKEIKV